MTSGRKAREPANSRRFSSRVQRGGHFKGDKGIPLKTDLFQDINGHGVAVPCIPPPRQPPYFLALGEKQRNDQILVGR